MDLHVPDSMQGTFLYNIFLMYHILLMYVLLKVLLLIVDRSCLDLVQS
jgi:hypothetical protein